MKQVKLLLTRYLAVGAVLFSLVSASTLLTTPMAFADSPVNDVCAGVGLAGGNNGCGSGQAVNDAIAVAINILSAIVGVAAVIMIMVAGARFVFSGGDANKVAAARSSIIYALVGVVAVVVAQVLVHFVLTKA